MEEMKAAYEALIAAIKFWGVVYGTLMFVMLIIVLILKILIEK